ncbi:hypothetical protein PVAP13_9KG581100 [Panicum virgatum]|uniref:Uncharacterized protein n=1 Tax=Panicum virgatum TaxID=38727 RepID=A0A8T0NZN9_PANVG|nr:hypothetical protein PVAP13_9KG581100 [Panicum virgatum]
MAALRNEDTPQSIALIRIAANALEGGFRRFPFQKDKTCRMNTYELSLSSEQEQLPRAPPGATRCDS